jgi:tetratricopeptide (TPR) repeat protein
MDRTDTNGKRITLPPPEWSSAAEKPQRHVSSPPLPLGRKEGDPAVEGAMRARLEGAQAMGDVVGERQAARALARWLASSGHGLDEAVALARRVMELEDDEGHPSGSLSNGAGAESAEVRLELATWLENLGEPAAAADVLRSLAEVRDVDPAEAARVLVRVGVLHARAGDARSANDALAQAVNLDPSDAVAAELRGTLAAWAPSVMSPSDAAAAYVDAAARRAAAGAVDAQLEDLLRAFDTDATSSLAVATLAAALTDRGKAAAADEVWRAHAAALLPKEPQRATAVHARRRLQARAAGDYARALGAALDEGLDGGAGAETEGALDELLLRVGLLEPLAARLELRAEAASGSQRARALEDLARLLAGSLASPERAAAARVSAVAADPTRDDSLVALRAHATATRDATHLVEALIRAIIAEGVEGADAGALRLAQVACARSLATLAEEQLEDAALATWAYDALRRLGARDPESIRDGAERNRARFAAAHERVLAAVRELEAAKDDARVEPLRALATLLRSMPDQSADHSRVLAELVTRTPDDRKWRFEAYRVAWRRHDLAEVTRLAREQLGGERALSVGDAVQARLALAAASRAMRDPEAANLATRDLLDETPGHRVALGAVWVNAVLAGDAVARGLALEQLAGSCSVPVRAVLCAVASEVLARAGDKAGARRAAEQGCQAEPSNARCSTALADAMSEGRDRTAASALERGINMVCARTKWCQALAEALEMLGESSYAVGWTQRCVALRPGDRDGISLLLLRVARARDGARLADVLAWVMSQPQPAAPLGDLVARALKDLVPLDADRAVILARRALDAFGPRQGALREAMLEVADAARDGAFAAIVLERAASVDFSADRAEVLATLARRRAALGDLDGEARALARAMREGVRAPELEARVQALSDGRRGASGLTSDGEIARLEARAEWFARGTDKVAMALAWRELGAALWDLAGDRVGAVRAWLRAAKVAPSRGYTTLGVDLALFAGARYALDCLSELVEKEPDSARSGSIAAEAARAALALDEPARAFELAAIALERNPRHADALEIAERGAVAAAREASMSRLYETLGSRAMGRFGCRAAHYRGARFFEQHGDAGLALKHAALAFCAVPSEGATFHLLKRTADRADDRAEAVRTVMQVADTAKSPVVRAGWLLRAAAIASADEEGCRLKVDVLLRAVLLAPDLGTLSMLTDAAAELLRIAPEEREALQVRLSRVSSTVGSKASGPEGARIALAFALMALDPFDDADWAMTALERAFICDADLDEYVRLVPHATRLAAAGEAGERFARMRAITERPYANVGAPALRLLAALATLREDGEARTRFVVMAAQRDPDDDALVREADAALRTTPDEGLTASLEKAVPATRRAEAFRTLARERSQEGAFDEAIKALERASELSDERQRTELEASLRAAYEAAGRAEEVEGRALREATAAHASPAARASRWTEVAQHREARGDLVGAVDALLAAASLDGAPIERWSAIERLAELARLEDVRVSAIREIVQRVAPDAKVAVWKRLARAYEARLDMSAAEATWNSILESDPNDEEADYALESLISSRGDYSDLANHLGRRAERLAMQSGTREALRAVRLRRAAILEQRLERVEDACDELLLVLRESPDNTSAMSYLADLYDRMGEHGDAFPLWSRVATLSRDPRAKADLELRAARTAVSAGLHAEALALARSVLEREPGQREALELSVHVCRVTGDDRGLGNALAELVLTSPDDAEAQSLVLVEAARAAERAGDVQVAIARAKAAADLAPRRVETQLLARALEYRARGSGTPDDARKTIDDLSRLPAELAPDDAALKAFLIAESLDAFQGGGAGARALLECEAEVGSHPLLELGLAERSIAQFRFDAALPHFQAALLGDLSAVRQRGRVALAAADAAYRADQMESAVRLLDEAAGEPGTRAAALMRKAQVFASFGNLAHARALLAELAESTTGEDRARALAQIGRIQLASNDPGLRAQASETFEQAIAAAPSGSGLRTELKAERDQRGSPPTPPDGMSEEDLAAHVESVRDLTDDPEGQVAPVPTPSPSPPSAPAAPSVSSVSVSVSVAVAPAAPAGAQSVRPGEAAPSLRPSMPVDSARLARAIAQAPTPRERSQARLALARAQLDRGSEEAAERCLGEGLSEGGFEEGEMLAMILAKHPERSADLVKVRRRLADLAPGDLGTLEMLRRAAILDQNIVYARAVEHVARAFDTGAGPLPPPPLAAQREHPGMLAHLTRASTDRVGQALSLIWESAYSTLARITTRSADAAPPSLRSASPPSMRAVGTRLLADGSSPLARIYETGIRLLGVSVPVYLRRSNEGLRGGVELSYPLAAILTGQVEDTPELPYVLGQALAAALPQNALLLGLAQGEAHRLWAAMLGAFGPTELGRSMDATSARLAETFWQTIPARVQRGLQELLASVNADEFSEMVERARQAGRRVGLFLSGDFGVAARALVAEGGGDPSSLASGDLGYIASRSAAFADLIRLAVSPDYADARWQPMPPASQRGTISSGRFRAT